MTTYDDLYLQYAIGPQILASPRYVTDGAAGPIASDDKVYDICKWCAYKALQLCAAIDYSALDTSFLIEEEDDSEVIDHLTIVQDLSTKYETAKDSLYYIYEILTNRDGWLISRPWGCIEHLIIIVKTLADSDDEVEQAMQEIEEMLKEVLV